MERIEKPAVVTSVTLGKELHAGHMLLLATADLVRRGTGSEEPIYLVNNNTGPRAAGAVISLAKTEACSIEEAALRLSRGQVSLETIVNSYRSRIEDDSDLDTVMAILDQGNIDIFTATATVMSRQLKNAGFFAQVVSEGANLSRQHALLSLANPDWAGCGFNFMTIGKAIKVLEKGGKLTATGKGVVALDGLRRQLTTDTEIPLLIFVDSSADTVDAVDVFSALPVPSRALQEPGAGIGFGGKMASGSKGEALTISEIMGRYQKASLPVTLNEALRQLVLTMPVTLPNPKVRDLSTAMYDFYDNDSLLRAIFVSAEGFLQSKIQIAQLEKSLEEKVSDQTCVDDSLTKWLQFLPERTGSLKKISVDEAVQTMKTKKDIRPKDQVVIEEAVSAQGYVGREADVMVKEYLSGQKSLARRENKFLTVLENLKRTGQSIHSLSPEDYELVKETIHFCAERLGYV